MTGIFGVIFSQILVMLFFILIGWLLRRFRILPESAGTVISKLLVWVFIPATIIKSLSSNFTAANFSGKLSILLAGTAVTAVCFLAAQPVSKLFSKDDYARKVYAYSFVIPNTNYVGVPLMMAVFGEEMCCNMVVFIIPMLLVMYTWGMYVLTGQEKLSLKSLNNPVMYAVIIGMLLGLSGVRIPEIPAKILENAGNCIAPCAMITGGYVVGSKPLKIAFGKPKAYIAALVRLVGIPALIALPMLIMKLEKEVIFISVITVAMPMGLSSIIFPEAIGQDASEGAGMVLISTILCAITVPVITMLLMKM